MLTQASTIIAHVTEPNYLFILALIISIFLYINKKKSYSILLASTTIITGILIKLLKETIQAPRPLNMLVLETSYSFPSGHTTFAVVFLGLLLYIFSHSNSEAVYQQSGLSAKRSISKAVYIALATITITAIALSRLILQVHYPIDILAGLIIGTTILTLSILTHKKLT